MFPSLKFVTQYSYDLNTFLYEFVYGGEKVYVNARCMGLESLTEGGTEQHDLLNAYHAPCSTKRLMATSSHLMLIIALLESYYNLC